jgi:hypothetical protein
LGVPDAVKDLVEVRCDDGAGKKMTLLFAVGKEIKLIHKSSEGIDEG